MPLPHADIDDKGEGCERMLVWIMFSPFMILWNLIFGDEGSMNAMSDAIESRQYKDDD